MLKPSIITLALLFLAAPALAEKSRRCIKSIWRLKRGNLMRRSL